MKSAYELAMERLNKTGPSVVLSDRKKKELAELDSVFQAKIAEREIFLKEKLAKASLEGNWDEAEEFQRQMVSERKALAAELEEKKEAVRQRKD